MKKKIPLYFLSFLFTTVLLFGMFDGTLAEDNDNEGYSASLGSLNPLSAVSLPGTGDDPLISLSYLNQVVIPQIENSIVSKLSGGIIATAPPETTSAPQGAQVTYAVVEMRQGQTIYPVNGSLEIIVRPGSSGTAVSPYQDQGLADLTGGDEIQNGSAIPINHAVLIPRSDGRGIRITSDVAYLMVRGEYTIG